MPADEATSRPSPTPLQRNSSIHLPTILTETTNLRPDHGESQSQLIREAERATIFQKASNDALEIPNGYRKVEVLILRWHESIDEFPDHAGEIDRLKRIFTLSFGFGCTIKNILNTVSPQLSLNHAIMSHVLEHPEPDTLLIVYYTGHGERVHEGDGRKPLRLSATNNWDTSKGSHPPVALWHLAEKTLLSDAAGDVLVILDCCFASAAATKGRNKGLRAYQLLAASQADGKTGGPGPNSFTTALCSSLEELVHDSDGDCFDVQKLAVKINEKRPIEAALVWDRLNTGGHVRLGRLVRSQQMIDSFKNMESESAFLNLRFSLRSLDLGNESIESLAQRLPDLCRDIGLPVIKIQWVKMEDHRHRIRRVRDMFLDRISRRNISGATDVPQEPRILRSLEDHFPSSDRDPLLGFKARYYATEKTGPLQRFQNMISRCLDRVCAFLSAFMRRPERRAMEPTTSV